MPEKRFLSRAETAEYLNSIGVRIAAGTLAKLASTGGGPPYRRILNRALYERVLLDEWVEQHQPIESATPPEVA